MPAYVRNTPEWHDLPSQDTSIDRADLEGWEHGLIGTNADLVVLTWNGSTYAARNGDVSLLTDSSKARMFIGPMDPDTVAGVVTTDRDIWAQYT